eukprot:jgi/Tetstr1/422502/TSEL_001264.t1
MDKLKDLVSDVELSLPAFNVVMGSYDPRSLKFTLLLDFKTMRSLTAHTLKNYADKHFQFAEFCHDS